MFIWSLDTYQSLLLEIAILINCLCSHKTSHVNSKRNKDVVENKLGGIKLLKEAKEESEN